MHVSGDTSAIIRDRKVAVVMDVYIDVFGKPRNGFVERVIDDFGDEVVKSPFVSATNIHSGTFSDGFETFENGNVFSGI